VTWYLRGIFSGLSNLTTLPDMGQLAPKAGFQAMHYYLWKNYEVTFTNTVWTTLKEAKLVRICRQHQEDSTLSKFKAKNL
jgi:hypothetical protein